MFYYDFKFPKPTEKNGVILFGGNLDKSIPVGELAQSFDFNFKISNKSVSDLSIKSAQDIFESSIKPLHPEAMILHIGEKDLTMFKANSSDFDSCYLKLIEVIKKTNSNCRIALVSIYNAHSNPAITEMNRHIKAIAESERCDFINIENAKLWNPAATKAAISFARNLGLSVKKPLRDVAEILYSYAYKNTQENIIETGLAG